MKKNDSKNDNRPIRFIKDTLDDDKIENIFEILSSIDSDTILYFSSQGGLDTYAELIIEILNKNSNFIELVAYGPLSSNGFEVFERFKGRKRLMPTTFGMIHLGDFQISARKINDTTYQDFILKKFVDEKNEEIIKKYTPYLSTEEIDSLRKGNDIWLDYERLKKIFKL